MTFEILFIEDNEYKRTRAAEFIMSLSNRIKITEAKSFTGGCQAIESGSYDLILLDISLPTFDRTGSDAGGRFRSSAGREIGRKIMRAKKTTPILFITQYGSFSDRGHAYTFETLKQLLEKECGENFVGMVFYDSSHSAWKNELSKIIEGLLN
jgi:CheY-like chemotaxis protein